MRSRGLAGCVLLLTALVVLGTSADAGSESLLESGPTQKSVEPQAAAVGERRVVPGTRFSLVPPAGFEPSGSFTGFEDRVNYARIVVLQHPIPFDELMKGFNEETFRERGWTLHRKEAVKVGENDGMLLFLTLDSQGVRFGHWSLYFGTESYTANVVAFFPEAQSAKFSEVLRQSVLSARLEATEPDPLANLPYTFEAPSKLKLWNRTSSLLTYTKDGTVRQLQASEPSGPLVLIYAAEEGPAEAALSVMEFCAAAAGEFISNSTLENIVLESPKSMGGRRHPGLRNHRDGRGRPIEAATVLGLFLELLFRPYVCVSRPSRNAAKTGVLGRL